MLVNFGAKKALVLSALILVLFYATFNFLLGHAGETRSAPVAPVPADVTKVSSICSTYSDDGTIAVALKTGATEAPHKLSALLETTLSCVQDLMVFSDLDQTLNGVQLHDVLARVELNVTRNNPDFDIYRKQQELLSQNREGEIAELSTMSAPPSGPETEGKNAAWALDKYKFAHMLERAYELQPNRDWYLFLEADTYLSWPNLKRWLAMENPEEKSYFGNAIRKSNGRPPVNFAHGGSGFVLSGAAMKELAVNHPGMAHEADHSWRNWWKGDIMLADILFKELGMQVTTTWPMFFHQDGDTQAPSGDDLNRPAIMAHPVQEEKARQLYGLELELELNASGMRVCDLYDILNSDETVEV